VANWTNTSQLLMQNIDIERQEKWLICWNKFYQEKF
jgi:hypothetical protein